MPPRVANPQRLSSSISSHISSKSSSISSHSLLPICPSCLSQTRSGSSRRAFSASASTERTALRWKLFNWLNGPGRAFKDPLPGSTNYLTAYDRKGKLLRVPTETTQNPQQEASADSIQSGDGILPRETIADLKPFPHNPYFVSESILSEPLRNEIYEQVKIKGKSVRAVSVLFGVEMNRVAAVVRLVELERRMVKEDKPLARPYARAVHEMVPTTPLVQPPQKPVAHEPINDLVVHRLTEPQIFYPVSESRQFTRLDAGRVFSAAPALPRDKQNNPFNTPEAIAEVTQNRHRIERVGKGENEEQILQPADVRIPHPHLVAFEHDNVSHGGELRLRNDRFIQRLADEEAAEAKTREYRKKKKEASIEHIQPAESRFEFRFHDAVVSRETTGLDGRGRKAPGKKYGVPNNDRKRGLVKIPTEVKV